MSEVSNARELFPPCQSRFRRQHTCENAAHRLPAGRIRARAAYSARVARAAETAGWWCQLPRRRQLRNCFRVWTCRVVIGGADVVLRSHIGSISIVMTTTNSFSSWLTLTHPGCGEVITCVLNVTLTDPRTRSFSERGRGGFMVKSGALVPNC